MDKLENGQFQADMTTKKYSDLKVADYKEEAKRMIDFVVEALNSGMLAQVQFHVDGNLPVTFALETNIINLPFSNWKRINNFFEEDQETDVKVYFEIASDYINVSKFRIDEFSSSDEIVANGAELEKTLADLMREKVEFIKENAVVMKEQAKERAEAQKVAEANKKIAAKKTTTKKKTTKKATTKKTAAKKTTKAAAKKTATKKTTKAAAKKTATKKTTTKKTTAKKATK